MGAVARQGRVAGRPWARRAVTIAVVAAVVSPAVRDRDSFPLSTYPVYASVRADTATFATAVGFDTGGGEQRLSMAAIAATDDPLIAQQRVSDAIASGRATSLCRTIAARAPAGVVTVLVVEERHDLLVAAAGGASMRSRVEHARCGRSS